VILGSFMPSFDSSYEVSNHTLARLVLVQTWKRLICIVYSILAKLDQYTSIVMVYFANPPAALCDGASPASPSKTKKPDLKIPLRTE